MSESKFPQNMYKQPSPVVNEVRQVVADKPLPAAGDIVQQKIQLVKDKYNSITPETKQKWWQIGKAVLVGVGVAMLALMALIGHLFDATQKRK